MSQTDIRHPPLSGIDITLLVDEAMDQDIHKQSSLLQKFSQGTAQVAIKKHHEYGRGFVYGECEAHQFFYMASSDNECYPDTLWKSPMGIQKKVSELLHDYHPQSEAILVMCLPPTLQVYLVDQDQQMQRVLLEELEDLALA